MGEWCEEWELLDRWLAGLGEYSPFGFEECPRLDGVPGVTAGIVALMEPSILRAFSEDCELLGRLYAGLEANGGRRRPSGADRRDARLGRADSVVPGDINESERPLVAPEVAAKGLMSLGLDSSTIIGLALVLRAAC